MNSFEWEVPKRYSARREIRNVTQFPLQGQSISLHYAASQGDFTTVKSILDIHKEEIDINEIDRRGLTALHHAARSGSKECVLLLLKKGSDILRETKSSQSNILHCAASSGNADLVKELLYQLRNEEKIVTIKYGKNKNGKIPAHCAAQSGSFETFLLLVPDEFDRHIYYNKANDGRMFHHLAAERGHLEMLQQLLTHRGNFITELTKNRTNQGNGIIHHAVRSGNVKLLEFVITNMKAATDHEMQTINAQSWDVLHIAALSHYPQMFAYVYDNFQPIQTSPECSLNFASFETEIKSHQTPLGKAVTSGCYEMVQLILSKGAKVSTPATAPLIHCAAIGGNIQIMKLLLQEKYALSNQLKEITYFERFPKNIFHCAVLSGDAEMIEFLHRNHLFSDDEINQFLCNPCMNNLPIIYACEKGNLAAVQYFIENRLYPTHNQSFIKKLLKMAAHSRYLDIFQYIHSQFKCEFCNHDENGEILEILSSWCNDIKLFKEFLLDHKKQEEKSKKHFRSLLIALEKGNIPIAKLLLENYILPNENEDSEYFEKILCCTVYGGEMEIFRMIYQSFPSLFKEDAIRDAFTKTYKRSDYLDDTNLLHILVKSQNLQMIKFFFERYSSLSKYLFYRSKSTGLTPIHLAAHIKSKNQKEILEFLLQNGAYKFINSRVSNFPGYSISSLLPYDIASSKKIRDILEKYNPSMLCDRFFISNSDAVNIELVEFYFFPSFFSFLLICLSFVFIVILLVLVQMKVKIQLFMVDFIWKHLLFLNNFVLKI